MSLYSEDILVEQPTIALFVGLGYYTAHCYNEVFGPNGTLGRETMSDVLLVPRLREAICNLNPAISSEATQLAIEELIRDRSSLNPVLANKEIYKLLKDGVKVSYRDSDGEETDEVVTIIDWNTPENNDFFLASQFWVMGDMYKRRADLIGFVNGLPLIFIELKASHRNLYSAYNDNLRDYKRTIPQLFWYNALIILSNGSDSKIGSITSQWEHYVDWKKINSEGEEGVISLETMIRGTCEKSNFIDILENFCLYSDEKGGVIKFLGRNHQYLGVNNAIKAVEEIRENQGKLGVFWHTQGSGKSYSMVFFSQKILRKVPGNWTFLIVTDRDDLDTQIYRNFANAGAVTEKQAQARSGEHLKQLLRENHRHVFTLIQKFRTEPGATYEMLSDRSDIIVITDEAHRSQYDTLALNMRNALPNAAFIAFTGTPLMAGEEKTKEVFGDYVSVYDFKQAVDDNSTVPLYYENRIPELQLTNVTLNEDMQDVVEAAILDEAQERKLEREFRRDYHLITREDRLDRVAEDIVSHFMGRGHMGKAMVICIDKVTTVKMYNKVQEHWKQYLHQLKLSVKTDEIHAKIKYMEETNMAVVVSAGQNEEALFESKGLDIRPHRQRMNNEDLETDFKNAANPFRIVFVCAMWLTGFDVPSLSTIYLDKPMRNHTLMQTIARANRVFEGKNNGLIVDYIGVFRDLQKALAIYGSGSGDETEEGEKPVKDKEQLVQLLKQALQETRQFCETLKININKMLQTQGYEWISLRDEAVEAILVTLESKKKYMELANMVSRLYKAILPDKLANEFAPSRNIFVNIAERILSLTPPANIEEVMGDVESLLDKSIAAEGYVIRGVNDKDKINLSQIDFEKLKEVFTSKKHKRTELEKLQGAINGKLQKMVRLNKTRMDYMETFQKMIDEYNAGSVNLELFFDQLLAFVQKLKVEETRSITENLSEEELAVLDILTKPIPQLTDKEKNIVKKVARDLLETLKQEKLVLDWRKRQVTRAQVYLAIENVLDDGLPRNYDQKLFNEKCQAVYQHVYENYSGQGKSVYANIV